MKNLVAHVTSLRGKLRINDDFVDQLNRKFTVILLISFAAIVGVKQFIGNPIDCWCPAQFTDSHERYANSICWASSSSAIKLDSSMITSDEIHMAQNRTKKAHAETTYHHWVPLFMLCQSLMVFTPCLIWKFLEKQSIVNMAAVMDAARESTVAPQHELREKAVSYIVNQMAMVKRTFGNRWAAPTNYYFGGCYLISGYMLIKILYIFNAGLQQLFLDSMLKVGNRWNAFQIFDYLGLDHNVGNLDKFPVITLCEFVIRHQSMIHANVVQCTLSINVLNEKLLVILRIWFFILTTINLISLVHWLLRAVNWSRQVQYVYRQIGTEDHASSYREYHGEIDKFTKYFLRGDGMFIIRLIGLNTSEMVASDILRGLWNKYGTEKQTAQEKEGRMNIAESGYRTT